MTATVPGLLDRLAESGLLVADELMALRRWVETRNPGLGPFAQHVVDRGLLTRFQLREVAAGRAAGLTLGPYRLLDLLGEGGMGRVFHGRHVRLGREVAIKVIRPERLVKATSVDRFLHEVRVAGRLHHPNVVLAFDADVDAGTHYCAMEYVPGADLEKVVREKGPLPVAEACGYIRQAADGLQHAADLGMVHRDVKPTNLLLTPDGRVKVLDLGLALLTDDRDAGLPNRVGRVVGSPDYLAPEQARHAGGVDCRADVYALGCTLFFLLTGRPPFGGDNQMDKVLRHLNEPPPSLLPDRPDVPQELDAVVRTMLAKDPADRPQSPAAVAASLAPFAVGGSGRIAPPLPTPPRPAEEPLFADLGKGVPPVRRSAPPAVRRSVGWVLPVAAVAGLLVVMGVVAVLLRGGSGGGGETAAEFTNLVGMKLIRIDGGSFTMGSPDTEPGRVADETQSPVTVGGTFYIGTTEVTHGQYHTVMEKSPAKWPGRMRDGKGVPVDSVTLEEAKEFCRRLTARDARRTGWAYRLPTEEEWEYAARGGTTTPFWAGDNLRFGVTGLFSPDADDTVGLGEPVGKGVEKGLPHPVGSTQANPFGLHEVCGNVWEWTSNGVLRGGSWKEPPARCRSASRRSMDPTLRAEDVGFRVVYAAAQDASSPTR